MATYLCVRVRLESGHVADAYYSLDKMTVDEMADKAIRGILDIKNFISSGAFREPPLPPGQPSLKIEIRTEAP